MEKYKQELIDEINKLEKELYTLKYTESSPFAPLEEWSRYKLLILRKIEELVAAYRKLFKLLEPNSRMFFPSVDDKAHAVSEDMTKQYKQQLLEKLKELEGLEK